VQAFFAPELSGMRDVARQVQVAEQPLYSPLKRVQSIMHLAFSYDPGAKLQALGVS
jgi:hypothetical protein